MLTSFAGNAPFAGKRWGREHLPCTRDVYPKAASIKSTTRRGELKRWCVAGESTRISFSVDVASNGAETRGQEGGWRQYCEVAQPIAFLAYTANCAVSTTR